MAYTMTFLCCALLFTCAAAQTTIRFLPTIYVTPRAERPISSQAVIYEATVCDGRLYHGNMTVVRVNMPHGWHPIIGYISKIEACQSKECDKIHCTNWPSNKFNGNHYCNFTYDKAMGDIFVRVTAGPAPNIDWTVAVEFVNKKTWVPPSSVRRSFVKRYYRYEDWPEPKATNGLKYAQVIMLMQIVKTANEQKVLTLSLQEYFFQFCPDRETGDRYDVVITAIAVDSKSAMSTYVCLPTELPCTVYSSNPTHRDSRGIGINTVTLTTSDRGLSNLHVLIVGWGDGSQTNTFELGATIKKKQ